MWLLLLKLVLAPSLVAAATLAQRRWGPAIGGRLVGLPLTAAPLLFVLALTDGTHFGTVAAVGDQAGDVAASAWCVVYALASRRLRPGGAFVVAGAAFAAAAVVLRLVHLDTLTATLAAGAAILAALQWWPRPAALTARPSAPAGDLPVRMLVAAGFTFALSESADRVGPLTAGLIGALPLVTIVLTVATHHRQGSAAANRFLHGVMSGSFSVVAFLAALAVALPHVGTAAAFAIALAGALIAQLVPSRQPPTARPAEPTPTDATGSTLAALRTRRGRVG